MTIAALALVVAAAAAPFAVRRIWKKRRIAARLGRAPGEAPPVIPRAWLVTVARASGLAFLDRAYADLLEGAGFERDTGSAYFGAKFVIFILVTLWCVEFVNSPRDLALWGSGLAGGWMAPDLILFFFSRSRRARLKRGLGLWLDLAAGRIREGAALDVAAAELVPLVPEPIRGEFLRVEREVQFGASRAAALGRMAGRTRLKELDTLASALERRQSMSALLAALGAERSREESRRLTKLAGPILALAALLLALLCWKAFLVGP